MWLGTGVKIYECSRNNNNNLRTLITDMTDDSNISLPADLVRGDVYTLLRILWFFPTCGLMQVGVLFAYRHIGISSTIFCNAFHYFLGKNC